MLSAVLPSAFTVDNLGDSDYNPALIEQAELQSTKPETVVYTINPKAVWSDGVPITATDFIYAWQHQRSVPSRGERWRRGRLASTDGYQDIASMTQSNHGHTVTVVFSTPYADWQQAVQRPASRPRARAGRLEPGVHHRRPPHRSLGRPL